MSKKAKGVMIFYRGFGSYVLHERAICYCTDPPLIGVPVLGVSTSATLTIEEQQLRRVRRAGYKIKIQGKPDTPAGRYPLDYEDEAELKKLLAGWVSGPNKG